MTYEPKFGDVLEHDRIRGVVYMLLHPVEAGKIGGWRAVALKDDSNLGSGRLRLGAVYTIGQVNGAGQENGWIIVDA